MRTSSAVVRTGDSGLFTGSEGNDKTVGEIVGRTVHPDGTIIPFTGKPYLKVLEKAPGREGAGAGIYVAGCRGGQHHRVPICDALQRYDL